MEGQRLPLLLISLLFVVLIPLSPSSTAHVSEDSAHDHVIITEVLVSPDDADHNGTDWNETKLKQWMPWIERNLSIILTVALCLLW